MTTLGVDSFEELGVNPELVEALAAEGIERPTPLQEAAIPVLRKGNNAVLAAGPGSGLTAAWSIGLLERLPPESDEPLILVLTATPDSADRLAEAVARFTLTTGHRVAALAGSWVFPERAHVLFGTPADVAGAAARSSLSLSSVSAVVVDQAQLIESLGDLADVERVLDYVDAGAQRILSALPTTPATLDLVERHVKRSVTIPAATEDSSPKRGQVRFRIVPEPREEGALGVVAELLAEGARHVLVFTRSEDRAADVGDFMTLHGFRAGAPGEEDAPVWLGVDALEARGTAKGVDGLVVVSCDAPTDTDELDRRHAIADNGVIVVVARELAHVKRLGKMAGYETVPLPPKPAEDSRILQLRAMVERAIAEQDVAPYLLALEPLFEVHDPAEVAAAAVALLRSRPAGVPVAEAPRVADDPGATPAWAKLFVGVGERDGLRPGDLLGAITGETGVPGDSVGRIDIKESHSLVEVHDAVARQVIRAINGTTIKGRSVRADFDRPRRGGAPKGRERS